MDKEIKEILEQQLKETKEIKGALFLIVALILVGCGILTMAVYLLSNLV